MNRITRNCIETYHRAKKNLISNSRTSIYNARMVEKRYYYYLEERVKLLASSELSKTCTRAKKREGLRFKYPQAKVLTCKESGHEIAFLKADKYAHALTNFLRGLVRN
jgi:hypothetical protein